MLKKAGLFFLFSLLISWTVLAQDSKLSQQTPLRTVYSHLYYLQPDSYKPDEAAKTINLKDPKEAEKIAVKLKQVLDGKGLFVDTALIPDNPNYVDTATGKHRYVLFAKYPEIYLEKVNDRWLYSNRTVQAVPKLHKEVYPFGSDWLVSLFGKSGQKQFLGLKAWQWYGILLILALTAILYLLLKQLTGLIIKRLMRSPYIPKDQRIVIQKAAGPLSMMVLTIVLEYTVPTLQLPINLAKYIVLVLDILTPVYATLAVYRLVDLISIYLWKKAEKTETTLDDQLVPLVVRLVRIIVVVLGFLYILTVFGVDVTAMLLGLSVGGIAIALAAQDTIKNLFGSLMIFLDRPFQIGDVILWSGMEGTVEEVGFRSTRVRTFQNSLISVPNGELANAAIDNYGLRLFRRYRTHIGVTYDTPPDLLEKYIEGLRYLIEHHPKTKKDNYEVHMNEMSSSSLNIIFHVFFEVDTWKGELSSRHDLIMGAIRLAEKLGVRFAFPSQTLYVEEFPGQRSLAPDYNTSREEIDMNIASFMKEYKEKVKTKE